MRYLVLLFTALLCAACTKNSITTKTDLVRADGSRVAARYLDQSYAQYRSQAISDVNYDLQFDLTKAENYSGISTMNFTMAEPKEISVDFSKGVVNKLVVNGKALEKFDYNDFFITIPAAALVAGTNTLEVTFTHNYNQSGSGLYRFVDPQDKKVYLYSDSEPYDANLLMPCFDQPDLKATYATRVVAPKDWVVVSSTRESKKELKGETNEWTFPRSKKFSTYIYSLHAGEYKIWESKVKTKNHEIPLRVMARQSLAKYVDPKEWFDTTAQGFNFYEDYFGYAYPYEKYDQLAVPDFNSGAMENVGAVTFNEGFISRGKKVRAEKRSLASVILHEMAHMWFGDLVTMKWWNDIWLNESFATYASYIAQINNTPYKEAWTDFILHAKGSAYSEDQLVTTHPITFTVDNTDVVFANFDGITYGKGASVLKQLSFYLGEENFKKGLQSYFSKYAFKNTELKDFMGELGAAAGKDLSTWQTVWLEKAQVNTIKAEFDCSTGVTKDFKLVQTAPKDYNTLRPHKTEIGIYTFVKDRLTLVKKQEQTYEAASTPVPGLDGIDCKSIALVYPNVDDQDYVKVELDPISLATVNEKISSISDDVMNVGLWRSLWDMVIDRKLIATDVLNIVFKHTLQEKSASILASRLGKGYGVISSYFPQDAQWKDQRDKLVAQWSTHLMAGAKAAPSEELQKIWVGFFISFARTPQDLATIADWLNKKPKWFKFDVDQEIRWGIISSLSEYGYKNYAELIDAELKKDPSSRGKRSALASRASVPDLGVKKEFWAKIIKGPSAENPFGDLRPMIHALFPESQEGIHKEFSKDFFASLKNIKDQPPEFVGSFVHLAPDFCALDNAKLLKDFVQNNGDLAPKVIKSLRVKAQQSERCVGIRSKIAEAKIL